MKFILSPLLIEKTSDIESLAKDILNYNGINFLTRKTKVGKIALIYKLMNWWEKKTVSIQSKRENEVIINMLVI